MNLFRTSVSLNSPRTHDISSIYVMYLEVTFHYSIAIAVKYLETAARGVL